MTQQALKDFLEHRQIGIYLGAVLAAGLAATLVPEATALEATVNPALALMLFVTFLQVPLAQLQQAATRWRFVAVLLGVNFVAIPALVAVLVQALPSEPMLRLAVLMVLLTPCIDYVVTFAHLGRADARLLLAATPVLLIAQMLLLPVYLRAFLGAASSGLVRPGPFFDAFVWLIALPLMLAGALQFVAARSSVAARLSSALGLLPVPATALVLFVVIAAVLPQLGPAKQAALSVLPVYLAFAVCAPIIGGSIAHACRLEAPAARAVAFSAATRNSLVVLPLAFAVPGAVPLLPALIVTQTLVELVSELVYVRLMPKLWNRKPSPAG